MKKFLVSIGLSIFILPISVFAVQNGQSTNSQSGQTNTATTPASSVSATQNQAQSQAQSQTQAQANTSTMTQDQIRTQLRTELQESAPSFAPKNIVAQQHRSQVAAAVENMIMLSANLQDATIGEQIRVIARNQGRSEDIVNQSLEKAQNRSAFAKFFAGPAYSQLRNVKQQIEENQLRIQQLNQIAAQISNQADLTNLQSQIQVLEEQNTSLEEQLNQDTKGFSLFGWLSKLISGF